MHGDQGDRDFPPLTDADKPRRVVRNIRLILLGVLIFTVCSGGGCALLSNFFLQPSKTYVEKENEKLEAQADKKAIQRAAEARAATIYVFRTEKGEREPNGQAPISLSWRNDGPDPVVALTVSVERDLGDGRVAYESIQTLYQGDPVPSGTTRTDTIRILDGGTAARPASYQLVPKSVYTKIEDYIDPAEGGPL